MLAILQQARDLQCGHVIRQGSQWCLVDVNPERFGHILRVRMRNEAGRRGVTVFALDESVLRLVEDDEL